jgi:hypothetical protein
MALALGSRRSTIAAVASAVAAMAIAISVNSRGCDVTEPGPEDSVHNLIAAIKADDVDTVLELLSPATRSRLEDEARRATDYVGAATRFAARDLISLSSAQVNAQTSWPSELVVVEQGADRAKVLVVSEHDRAHIELVRVDGLWRIDLPDYPPRIER